MSPVKVPRNPPRHPVFCRKLHQNAHQQAANVVPQRYRDHADGAAEAFEPIGRLPIEELQLPHAKLTRTTRTMAAADVSSPDLQRAINRRAGNRLRLDEIRSKQIVVVKRSRKRSRSDVGEAGPSNAPASSVLAVCQVWKTWKKRKDYPSLRSRSSTSQFFEALQGLNAVQTATIIEMGFASLFHLQIDNLPIRMGYWLVQNYNPRNSTLYLVDGIGVSITEQDVQLVLGFPRGNIKIEKWSRANSTDLLEEWKGLVDKLARGYLYSDVIKAMLNCEDGEIPRQIPSFVGWTAQLIKDREVAEIQAGGFGLGRVEDRFIPAVENMEEQVEECHRSVPEPAHDDQPSAQPQSPVGSQSLFDEDGEAQKLDLLRKTIVEVIELASKPPASIRDNELIKLMHSAAQKLLRGGRVTVDSSIQKDVEASCSQDSFWCNPENIAAMDAAILRREQYLKKVADMPSFSLDFTQACSPSSHHQEEEQMEVCEGDAALEERGGCDKVAADKDVVVEERAYRVEMVVEKESALDERVGGVNITGEKVVLVDESVNAVLMGCEKDSLVDKSGVVVAASEERPDVLLGEGSMMDKGKGIIVDDSGKELEIQIVEKQEVERRSRKITIPLRSPYLVRQINVGQFLTATEKVY
nr:hypothetical protein DM860_011184 [Ipomoea batatas]